MSRTFSGNRSKSYVLSRMHDYVQGTDNGLGLPGHNHVPLGFTPGGDKVPGLAAPEYNDMSKPEYSYLAILQHVQDRHAGTEPKRSAIFKQMHGTFPGWTSNDHVAAAEGHEGAAHDAAERRDAFAQHYVGKTLSRLAHERYVIAHKQLDFDHKNHLRIAAAHRDAAAYTPPAKTESRADTLIREALLRTHSGKPNPLTRRAANAFGEPVRWNPDTRERLAAVVHRAPTHDTWNDAHSIIVSPHGGFGGTTLWQAVRAVDPTFPARGRTTDSQGNIVKDWERIPDQMLIGRALKHAASLKPRRRA